MEFGGSNERNAIENLQNKIQFDDVLSVLYTSVWTFNRIQALHNNCIICWFFLVFWGVVLLFGFVGVFLGVGVFYFVFSFFHFVCLLVFYFIFCLFCVCFCLWFVF